MRTLDPLLARMFDAWQRIHDGWVLKGGTRSNGQKAPQGGARFPVDARVDGRTFVA